MKKILLAATIFFGFTSFSYSQTLDQPNSPIGTGSAIGPFSSPTEASYQSFTAGITGQLSEVRLTLANIGSPTNPMVEIFSGSVEDANLGAEALGMGMVSNFGTPSPVQVVFPISGVNVTAGMKYSIKITGGTSVFYFGESANVYSGGQHTTIAGNPDPTTDVNFETYVIAPTIPAIEDLCGTTLDVDQGSATVNSVSGATQYSFFFINNNSVWSKENRANPALDFRTIDAPELEPGTTYSVFVKAFGPGIDSVLLNGCSVTTFSQSSTQLISADCGKIMESNETLTAEEISGADRYQFVFTSEGQQSIVKEQSGRIYNFPFYASNFAKGTTYNVRIASRVSGNWSELGPVCTFTTPGAEQGELLNCGTNYTSWNQNVNAQIVSGAQKYHFLFNENGNQTSYFTTKPYVKLRNVNGLIGATDYSVRVRVQKNGVFGLFSPASCLINTPTGAPTRNAEFAEAELDIFMYPNPTSGNVVYFSSTIHNVSLFSVEGNLMMTKESAESLDISGLTPGLYMVKSNEGLAKLMVR